MTTLREKLTETFPSEESYLPILNTLKVVGVAENPQLQQASGMPRDKLRRTMQKLEALGAVHMLRQDIRRRTGRGRSPRVWRLEKAGAALLNTRPSKLEDERAITHALGMLDVHLRAVRDGLETITDKPMNFTGGVIRPDLRVTLPDGTQALFEIEQDATPRLLRRITTSLRHKQRFFATRSTENISSIVRMVVALPAGTAFERTLNVWHQALDVLRSEVAENELAFQLAAIPLPAFLDQPDWDEPPTDSHWVWLTSSQTRTTGGLQRFLSQVPHSNPLHDRLILAALLQELHLDSALARKSQRYPKPDPAFFQTIQVIYAASHAEGLSPLAQATYPWASLFLLRHYLHLHPVLRTQIERRLRASATTMRWNTTVILHRMQGIVDLFLAYHGWRSDGPLLVFAETPPWNQEAARTFRITARIRHREILVASGDNILPRVADVRTAEHALAWVLTALFRYAPDLGFKAPPFW